MKYNIDEFSKAVDYYFAKLKSIPGDIFVYGVFNEKAFLSMAPLSRAAHELGKDIYVSFYNKKHEYVLFDVWAAFEKNNPILNRFIKEVERKSKVDFKRIFRAPELIFEIRDSFSGNTSLDFHAEWFRKYNWAKLNETAKLIIKKVLSPKKGERFAVSFELIPNKEFLDQPLEDYLDSYAIALSVILNSEKNIELRISSSSPRKSMLDEPEKVAELTTTLLGCELSKNIDEPIFVLYKKLSDELNLSRLQPSNVIFGIRGKGYAGRHYFGESIGYPTPDKKSRWDSPGGILYKFSWYPQSNADSRLPQSRIGFTSTVPLDVFIDSVLINYEEMRSRNKKIQKLMEESDKIIVKSNIEKGSNFEVGLIKKDNSRREVKASDSDARYRLSPEYQKQGKYFGMMANIPGGEAFTTPEYVSGTIVGDVVISLDRSYRLSPDNPMVIEAKKNKYKVVGGDKTVLQKLTQKREEAWRRIMQQQKNKSVPKNIIDLKKNNFNNIGEFAINTNPKARLCDYLIVNEKIANMIHIALGSGFEADRATEYHIDIVIDSPRQKLDIYGVDSKGNEHWIIKEGKFAV